MKKTEVVPELEKGTPLVCGEWRSAKAERLQGTSARTNKAYNFVQASHNIEVGGVPMEIKQELPAETKEADWKAPFTKGQIVMVKLGLEPGEKNIWRVSAKEITPYASAV